MVKKVLLIIGGLFAVFVVIGIIAAATNPEAKKSFDKGQNQAKQVVEGQPTTTATPIPQSPEQKIEAKVRASLTGNDKIREVTVIKQVNGGYGVMVHFNASDNLSEDFIKKSIWGDMAKIYTALYKEPMDIATASLFAHFPMKDKYGNSSDEVVMKTSLDKGEATKVNWNQDQATLSLQILPQVWTTDINRFK